MSMGDYRLQDPGESLDHPIDWSDWLQTGETISSVTGSISPSTGVTLSSFTEANTTSTVTVSGLTFGQVYRLTFTIVTNADRTGTWSLTIRCGKR